MAVVPKVGDITTTQNVHQASKSVECFICQGPYRTKDCPRMEELFALQNIKEEDSYSDDPVTKPQSSISGDHPLHSYFFCSTDVCVCSFEWDRCEGDG